MRGGWPMNDLHNDSLRELPLDDKRSPASEGLAEFVLVSKDNADGTPAQGTPAERERMNSLIRAAQDLAAKHGLPLVPQDQLPPEQPITSTQARDIRALATPQMDRAAADFGYRGPQSVEIETKEGDRIRWQAGRQIDARLTLDGTLASLGKLVATPFRWSGRICVKVGKWIGLDAKAANESDAEPLTSNTIEKGAESKLPKS